MKVRAENLRYRWLVGQQKEWFPIWEISVRPKVIESYESDVIQGWPWQIEHEADVDSRKPRLLCVDRRRMLTPHSQAISTR